MFKDSLLDKLFPTWLSVQTDLANVLRWDIYINKDENLRKQSTLHHQYSMCFVLLPVLLRLRIHYSFLDTELMKDAFLLHDIPEGTLLMKCDVINSEKKQSHDIAEYLSFIEHFKKLDSVVFEYMHRAYVLQFANKSDLELSMFPSTARFVIEELRKTKAYEVKLFRALEQWEYIFYGYEAYLHKGNEFLLVNILREHIYDLQRYAIELTGFREVVFTTDFENEAIQFIEERKNIPKPIR